jgi:hypothetical protein
MLDRIRSYAPLQLLLGLLAGVVFGFLLQRGGVTRYEVLIGQLLLIDFTVLKVMLTAALTGMVGIYAMKRVGWVELRPKPGSVGSSVVGGLIFGVGFGLLGYCPGTVMGAVAQGSLDALFGGVIGLLMGSRIYAALHPKLTGTVLKKGRFTSLTIPELIPCKPEVSVAAAGLVMLTVLLLFEVIGV